MRDEGLKECSINAQTKYNNEFNKCVLAKSGGPGGLTPKERDECDQKAFNKAHSYKQTCENQRVRVYNICMKNALLCSPPGGGGENPGYG